MKTTIQTLTAASAIALLSMGLAQAQLAPSSPTAPSASPSPGAPPPAGTTGSIGKADPALEAKWKALDKDGKGLLEGPALDTFKTVMTQVDTDNDGKISKDEFMAATKAGIIK